MHLARIDHLLIGKAVPYTRPGTSSAIAKAPVAGQLRAGAYGLAGDEQGDLRVHGGLDKAIHHYPREHYRHWQARLGKHALLESPGAFGENISTCGLAEADLCLGDVLRCGEALLQVTQSRQPCWKLNERFGVRDMAAQVQQSGMTGWYYRVLVPGLLEPGQALRLEDRAHPDWPLSRILELLYQRTLDIPALERLSELPLVPSWRKLVERRLRQRQVEDWSKRLYGRESGAATR